MVDERGRGGIVWVAVVAVALLVTACGGGSGTPDPAKPAAWPVDRGAADAPPPAAFAARRRALGSAAVAEGVVEPDPLFNWAQREFPQYFPAHAITQQSGPWSYRAYPASGVMLGLNAGEVYVVGGPFGSQPLRVGRATDFVAPAMPVWPTSYENRLQSTETGIPTLAELGVVPEPGETGFNQRIAFADFFQEGRYSAVAFSWMFKGVFPATFNPLRSPDSGMKAYFLKRDAGGRWIDATAQLLPEGDRSSCITPTFIEVADLNNDRRPDVVVACTGVDFSFELPAGQTDARPYWVSRQYALLSQPDGRYRRVEIPVDSPVKPFDDPGGRGGIYAHQATVADIDGDGNADILYTDPVGNGMPIVMWGRGDGSFRQDLTRFPADTHHQPINGIRALPANGQLQVIVSGNHPGSDPDAPGQGYGTRVLRWDGSALRTAEDWTSRVPPTATGAPFAFAHDFVRVDGATYGFFVGMTSAQQAIVRLDDGGGPGRIVFTMTGGVGGYGGNSGNLTLKDGALTGINAGCGARASDPKDFMHFVCAIHVPL